MRPRNCLCEPGAPVLDHPCYAGKACLCPLHPCARIAMSQSETKDAKFAECSGSTSVAVRLYPTPVGIQAIVTDLRQSGAIPAAAQPIGHSVDVYPGYVTVRFAWTMPIEPITQRPEAPIAPPAAEPEAPPQMTSTGAGPA